MPQLVAFLTQVYDALLSLGLFRYILPWLLVLFLLYGVLRNVKLFGGKDEGRRIDMGVSLVLSILITAFTPFQEGVFAAFISTYFGYIAVVLIILLFGVMFAGLLTDNSVTDFFGGKLWIPVTIGFIAATALAASGGAFRILPTDTGTGEFAMFFSPSMVSFLAVSVGLILLIYWALWKSSG